jgi:Fe(3+) dicitrate transport protein
MQPGIIATAIAATLSATVAAAEESAPPATPGPMEVVTIIGSRDDARAIAGSSAVITAEDIARFQDTDIQRILSQVPGIYFREEEGYGLRPNISIRGSYGDRSSKITLMEDGVLIAPAPYTAASAYYFPTTGRIAGVEVLKGPAAIENGPYTIGGAVNMLSTPIPDATSGTLLAEGGDDSTYRLHATYGGTVGAGGNWGYLVEGHTWGSDGFSSIDNADNDTGFEKNDLLAKLRYATDADARFYQQVDLKLQYSDEDSDQTYVGLTEADFDADPSRRYGMTRFDNMDNEHKSVNLSHLVELAEGVRLTTTAYYNEFTRDWYKVDKIDGEDIGDVITCANGGDCADLSSIHGTYSQAFADGVLGGTELSDVYLKHNNRDYESKGVQTRLAYGFETGTIGHDLSFGARYHEDFEERRQPVDRYLQGDDGSLVLAEPGSASRSKKDADAWSAYLSDEISVGDWTIKPGVRYEDYTINDVAHDETLWGLGTTWAVTDGLQLLAGVYEGHSPSASADSDPETATNYEAGFRYTSGALYTEVIGFFSDYDNIIGVCTNSGGAGPEPCEAGDTENGGEAEIKGMEVQASYALAFAGAQMPLSLSYTYTDAEFSSSFTGSSVWGEVEEGDELPNLPEHQLYLTAGLVLDNGFGTDLRLRYFDDTCATAACDEFQGIDSYHAIDLSAYYDWRDDTRFFVTVDNITDEDGDIVARQPKAGARGQQPRTVLAGVRYNF